ncbi:hypothetical protein GSI_00357 [Ganoderma sinense ZZ0214-1]|uniref:NADP-dependent oxidoreductase domain-containing protein n=1 Tax=Ganoderma sinense ZZ0214-1 TaxID=1077348 RepID=A0A2G8SSW6_9APHY|nr:hypothetical protein GSI_00357 [Ganoderma sinense ZZ0214-1]
MITATTKLGGTATNVVVAKVAGATPIPDEQAFESIKSSIDALPEGVKMMLNSAEFYGHGGTTGNLELLARFFEECPDYADKPFLSVKGGAIGFGKISGRADDLRNSVDKSIVALRGTKKIEVPIENIVGYLVEFFREGKFDHIGLSECRAEGLHDLGVYPISVVEIQISPISYEEETKKVLAASAELNISVAAYSCPHFGFYPLGHGLIAGKIKGMGDLPAGSWMRDLTRLKDENLPANLRLIDAILAMAAKKNCTPGQLSIAWVGALGEKVNPLPGSTRKERTLENLHGGEAVLSKEDLDEFAQLLDANPVKGDQDFWDAVDLKLWG